MKTLLLDKTFQILESLTNAENPLSLKEICAQTGITPPAASRILADLTGAGYVHKVTYRTFEPGLGMISLGQSSLRHNFFPQKAIRLLQSGLAENALSGALAGMFNGRLVYLYHSSHLISGNPFLPMEQQIYGSNIALVILCIRFGPDEAFRILRDNLYLHIPEPDRRKERESSILARLQAFQNTRFSVWNDGMNTNLCFPLVDGEQIYGLSFLFSDDSRKDRAESFLKCSMLVAEMRKFLSKT